MSARPHPGAQVEKVSMVAALPGLAQIAGFASIRLVEWTAGAYLRAGSRLVSRRRDPLRLIKCTPNNVTIASLISLPSLTSINERCVTTIATAPGHH